MMALNENQSDDLGTLINHDTDLHDLFTNPDKNNELDSNNALNTVMSLYYNLDEINYSLDNQKVLYSYYIVILEVYPKT